MKKGLLYKLLHPFEKEYHPISGLPIKEHERLMGLYSLQRNVGPQTTVDAGDYTFAELEERNRKRRELAKRLLAEAEAERITPK